jgi:hypothetical protein
MGVMGDEEFLGRRFEALDAVPEAWRGTTSWLHSPLRLSAALLAAGRPHTVLPLPGAGHSVLDDEGASR